MFETLALILYMITLFGGSQLFFMMYYDQSASELKWIFPELNEMQLKAIDIELPLCIKKFHETDEFFGYCPEWLFLELVAWACFVTTLIILMIKSRFF